MHTRPRIAERGAQPYVALRRVVTIPFGPVIDVTLPALFQWLDAHGVEPVGPPFFKYNLIDMAGELEIDFGVPTAALLEGPADVVAGMLPAGRYVTLTHHGHYDGLVEATGALLAWAAGQGLELDQEGTARGDRFAGRFEVYPSDPRDVPNPDDWETEIWIKLKD